MLTVGMLGPLEVRRDGRPLPVPSGKTTELLARLALDAGEVVSAERLIEDLWGDNAAATGRNTLQSKVSQLRRALADPALVTSGHGGYTLRLLDGAPPLRILATSQAPLGVDGEAVHALDPLSLADSVTLFADRAARTRRRFALDGDTTATVEAVCR